MSDKAEIIRGIIQSVAPKIAVIFSGSVPRQIGTLDAAPSAAAVQQPVEGMLASQRLSATYISVAQCFGDRFVLAHG